MPAWKQDIYRKYNSIRTDQSIQAYYDGYKHIGKSIIKRHIPSDKDVRILDLGCGYGLFLRLLKDFGYHNLLGVDTSEEMIQLAKQSGLEEIRWANIKDFLYGAEDQTFDVIILIDVIEHFKIEEILWIIKEVHRVLALGGSMIIHVPNAEAIFGSKIRYSDITHEEAFTEKSLTQIAKHCGFSEYYCYEDKPIAHGILSLFRRLIWEVGTFFFRVLHASETGVYRVKLSQNILFKAIRSDFS